MAARVRTGVLTYNMPDVYGMSKEAYEGSLKGTLGRNIGRVGKAIAARNAAERIAAAQANKRNSAIAKYRSKTGEYLEDNYDKAYNLEFGEVTEEDKKYDPFSDSSMTADNGMPTDVDPLFLDYELDEDLDTGRLNQEDKLYL